MPAAQAPTAANSRVIPEFLNPTHGTPAPATRAAALASAAAVGPGGPFEPMPGALSRAIRATAAAMPDQGDDPEACLASVIDTFQEFNPIDAIEISLVSQFVLLGAAFPHLMRRTTDPDLPPAVQERLTRTALAITRTQDRILRLLRPENGVSLLAPRDQWAAWKETLLREEAARTAARQASEAAREVAEITAAAEETLSALAPKPGTMRNDLMQSGTTRSATRAATPATAAAPAFTSRNPVQSGESLAQAARRAGWLREDRTAAAAGALFPRHLGEDLIARAAKAAVNAAGVKPNAAKEPLAP